MQDTRPSTSLGPVLRRRSSLRGLVRHNVFGRHFVHLELFRHRLERGIKLHETVLHRGVVFVALPARTLGIGLRCSIVAKAEVSPLVGWELRRILYFHADAHQIFGLKMP